MKSPHFFITLFLALFIVTACSSVQYKEQDVLSRDNAISTLNDAIDQGESDELGIYAPESFQAAKEKYATALANAKTSNKQNAGINEANEGLKLISMAKNKSGRSKEVLRLAYEMRDRALDADAASQYPERVSDAEEELIEAATLVENGEEQKARVQRDEIIGVYTGIELDSLKSGTTAAAIRAYEEAIKYEADEYAPKSFELAKKEISLTKKVIEADRSQVKKARLHAERSKYLSERAKEIAIIVKSFERRDFSDEDMVLWYHSQLDELAKPLETDVKYNQSNKKVIAELVRQIAYFQGSITDGVVSLKEKQAQINNLEDKISSLLTKQENKDFLDKQQEQRFANVRNLFNRDEARVYRIAGGVLIKAHGFDFAVGDSNIEVQNYPLIKKIIDAIYQFPKAKMITVTGHTDSTGSDSLNLKLSKQRAENVKKLLVSIGEVPAAKVDTFGFGEKKPVESNNTEQGRAFNRRIEIKIVITQRN